MLSGLQRACCLARHQSHNQASIASLAGGRCRLRVTASSKLPRPWLSQVRKINWSSKQQIIFSNLDSRCLNFFAKNWRVIIIHGVIRVMLLFEAHLQAWRILMRSCHPERSVSGSRRAAGLQWGYQRLEIDIGGKSAEVSIGRMKERLPSTKLKEKDGFCFLRWEKK